MPIKSIADDIIAGRRITRDYDLDIFLSCDLDMLCECADKIRNHFCGKRVTLCSIINGRSGRCPEDCKYCAQSAHYHTGCNIYGFLPKEKIVESCRLAEKKGIDRFAIVTSGRSLSGEDFQKAISTYETLKKECNIGLCASMGFLTKDQLHILHMAGVTCYHHNIETSERNFQSICTTHTYKMRIETLKAAKSEGMLICSGGIIGMGETWDDRLDMAISLSELHVDSIPINALIPIKGTPLQNIPRISEDEILRTVAFFRFINPTAHIRLAAGRSFIKNNGERAFRSGASAMIIGDMLTTTVQSTIDSDKEMLKELGLLTKDDINNL